jgi:hypothetical protein
MRGKHKLTIKQKHELRGLYKDGARDVDLAEWFGISEATVRGHTKDIRRPNPRRTFDYTKAAKLRGHGMNYEAIARRLGVPSGWTVLRAIRRHNAGAAA